MLPARGRNTLVNMAGSLGSAQPNPNPDRYAVAWHPLLVLLAVAGCGPAGDGRASSAENAVVPAVEALQARSGTLPLEERLSGNVKAQNQVAIRAEISAPIVEVLVRSGEAVERGQPLVRLEDDALSEQLRRAEASVRLAVAAAAEARARIAELEAEVKRTRALAGEDLVSALELETQEARLAAARASADQAEARVDEARASAGERRAALAKTLVRPPVAGRVGQRDAEVGMIADAGVPLFMVGNLDELMIEVPLTEAMLGYLRADGTRPVAFRPVEVLAEGRGTAGVRGAEPGEWVVTVGQHLLHAQNAEAASVRTIPWERVLELQGLQQEDLLRGFLEKSSSAWPALAAPSLRPARTWAAAPSSEQLKWN